MPILITKLTVFITKFIWKYTMVLYNENPYFFVYLSVLRQISEMIGIW